MIEKLIQELQKLRAALEILEQIWREVGPYHTNEVSKESVNKMREFFEFDDSE